MIIKCIIIDDEQPAIDVLENYIKKVPNFLLVATATNPIMGLELIKENKPDLVFLDIQMEEMTGIELVEFLDEHIKVILCTAYSQFAVISYELNIVDYLIKPVPLNRFLKAVEKVLNYTSKKGASTQSHSMDYIFMQSTDGQIKKVNINEIDYLLQKPDHISVHIGKRSIKVAASLIYLEQKLPGEKFIRVHPSYIVALDKITAIGQENITISGTSTPIPIEESYRDLLLSKMKDRIL